MKGQSTVATFDDINPDTPRLVVKWHINSAGAEEFQWGIVGSIPLVTLIGAVELAITGLPTYIIETMDGRREGCPEQAFVIAYDKETKFFTFFVHKYTPMHPMTGMLALIRATLVDTTRARHMAAQQVLLGPDGQPTRRPFLSN